MKIKLSILVIGLLLVGCDIKAGGYDSFHNTQIQITRYSSGDFALEIKENKNPLLSKLRMCEAKLRNFPQVAKALKNFGEKNKYEDKNGNIFTLEESTAAPLLPPVCD